MLEERDTLRKKNLPDEVDVSLALYYADQPETGVTDACLRQAEIRAYLSDEFNKSGRDRVVAHIAECSRCSRILSEAYLERKQIQRTITHTQSTKAWIHWLGKLEVYRSPFLTLGSFAAGLVVIGGVYLRSLRLFELKSNQLEVSQHVVEALRKVQTQLGAELKQKTSQIGSLMNEAESNRRKVALNSDPATDLETRVLRLAARALTEPISAHAPHGLASLPAAEGLEADIAVMSPNDTAVADVQPVLRWKPPVGVSGLHYLVKVGTVSDIANSDPIESGKPELKIPSGRLKAGGVYVWQVTAAGSDFHSDYGKFTVLDEAGIANARHVFADVHLGPIERALFAADVGLLDDAESEFGKANVKDSAFRQKFQAAIRAARSGMGSRS